MVNEILTKKQSKGFVLSKADTHFTPGEAGEIALEALVWTLSDEKRAERLLALTGLTPDALRSGLRETSVQLAVLDFLAAHEADMLGAATALEIPPERLAAARMELAR